MKTPENLRIKNATANAIAELEKKNISVVIDASKRDSQGHGEIYVTIGNNPAVAVNRVVDLDKLIREANGEVVETVERKNISTTIGADGKGKTVRTKVDSAKVLIDRRIRVMNQINNMKKTTEKLIANLADIDAELAKVRENEKAIEAKKKETAENAVRQAVASIGIETSLRAMGMTDDQINAILAMQKA